MISAVIFDLDGTVLDNEGMWEDAFRTIARDNQLSTIGDQNKWIHQPGIGVMNNWKKLVKSREEAEKLTRATKLLYSQIAKSEEVRVMPGVVELVESIKQQGWKTALATSTEWHSVESQLEELDLYLAFDITTTGEEVLASKPDPEIYLLTVQKLGLDPQECVVVEDAPAGIIAAKEAGCIVIGLTSSQIPALQLTAVGADFVVDNLSEVMLLLLSHGNKNPQENQSN